MAHCNTWLPPYTPWAEARPQTRSKTKIAPERERLHTSHLLTKKPLMDTNEKYVLLSKSWSLQNLESRYQPVQWGIFFPSRCWSLSGLPVSLNDHNWKENQPVLPQTFFKFLEWSTCFPDYLPAIWDSTTLPVAQPWLWWRESVLLMAQEALSIWAGPSATPLLSTTDAAWAGPQKNKL